MDQNTYIIYGLSYALNMIWEGCMICASLYIMRPNFISLPINILTPYNWYSIAC